MKQKIFFFLFLTVLFAACKDDDDLPTVFTFDGLIQDSVDIQLNPNGIAPLSAVADFTTTEDCTVEIAVMGEAPLTHHFDEPSTTHSVPVLGLYPNTSNQVIITLHASDNIMASDTFEIQTEPLPEHYPEVVVETANTPQMEHGWNLCEVSYGYGGNFYTQPIVFDNNGDVRWTINFDFAEGWCAPIDFLDNGNVLFGHGNTIYEYALTGEEVNTWNIDGYHQHHDIHVKPDGNLLVAVAKDGLSTTDDHIIEVDRESGAIVNEWDIRQVLDVDRYDLVENDFDWFHMNAIWYSESDDCLIVSGRNQGVIKLTANNELVWILAPHQGWGTNGNGNETSDYLLTALRNDNTAHNENVQLGTEEPEDFGWVWGQHTPMILPNGHIFVFDNGFNRCFEDPPSNLYSRAVEYEIDEENQTVKQVWEYGKERGDECFSAIISDVDYLPETQNRLFIPGIMFGDQPYAKIVEVTYPGKDVVFEATLNFKNLLGSGEFAWGEFDLMYRAERTTLYQ